MVWAEACKISIALERSLFKELVSTSRDPMIYFSTFSICCVMGLIKSFLRVTVSRLMKFNTFSGNSVYLAGKWASITSRYCDKSYQVSRGFSHSSLFSDGGGVLVRESKYWHNWERSEDDCRLVMTEWECDKSDASMSSIVCLGLIIEVVVWKVERVCSQRVETLSITWRTRLLTYARESEGMIYLLKSERVTTIS